MLPCCADNIDARWSNANGPWYVLKKCAELSCRDLTAVRIEVNDRNIPRSGSALARQRIIDRTGYVHAGGIDGHAHDVATSAVADTNGVALPNEVSVMIHLRGKFGTLALASDVNTRGINRNASDHPARLHALSPDLRPSHIVFFQEARLIATGNAGGVYPSNVHRHSNRAAGIFRTLRPKLSTIMAKLSQEGYGTVHPGIDSGDVNTSVIRSDCSRSTSEPA